MSGVASNHSRRVYCRSVRRSVNCDAGVNSGGNVQRILLLAGLCWISLSIGALIVMEAILSNLPTTEEAIARHMEWVVAIPDGFRVIGVVPLFIGVAHLIVYAVGGKKER